MCETFFFFNCVKCRYSLKIWAILQYNLYVCTLVSELNLYDMTTLWLTQKIPQGSILSRSKAKKKCVAKRMVSTVAAGKSGFEKLMGDTSRIGSHEVLKQLCLKFNAINVSGMSSRSLNKTLYYYWTIQRFVSWGIFNCRLLNILPKIKLSKTKRKTKYYHVTAPGIWGNYRWKFNNVLPLLSVQHGSSNTTGRSDVFRKPLTFSINNESWRFAATMCGGEWMKSFMSLPF